MYALPTCLERSSVLVALAHLISDTSRCLQQLGAVAAALMLQRRIASVMESLQGLLADKASALCTPDVAFGSAADLQQQERDLLGRWVPVCGLLGVVLHGLWTAQCAGPES